MMGEMKKVSETFKLEVQASKQELKTEKDKNQSLDALMTEQREKLLEEHTGFLKFYIEHTFLTN